MSNSTVVLALSGIVRSAETPSHPAAAPLGVEELAAGPIKALVCTGSEAIAPGL